MSDESTIGVLERPRQHRENRKKNIGRKVADNQAQAVAKFLRVPPRKARLVLDAVRGKYASEALAFLRFIPNRAAQYISKVLTSAVANAANNHGLNPENLKLIEARVDEGPRMKRVQPRAQGRAYRILKRMCHITVTVEEVEPRPRKPKKLATRRDQSSRRTAVAPATGTSPALATVDPEIIVPVTAEIHEQSTVPNKAPAEVTESETAHVSSVSPTPATESEAESSEASAETAPEVADTQDKTDEIGAPVVG